jgi:chaperonin GroES
VPIHSRQAVAPATEAWARSPYPSRKKSRRGPESGARRKAFMKIRPLQDRILVKRIDEEEITKGGIIIPDSAKEKPSEGKVMAVGNGKVRENGEIQPLDVKRGDKILFSKYAGTEVNIDGDEHIIIREDDVLGVCE